MSDEVSEDSLSGKLLLAHPHLRDPNFRRTVVLLFAHSREDGALGVIVNRPLGKNISELGDHFEEELSDLKICLGGPVCDNQLVFAAWTPVEEEGRETHFGIDPDDALKFMSRGQTSVCGFVGYSGWSPGQLEGEMDQGAWVVANGDTQEADGEMLWKKLILKEHPELFLLVDAPEDPSLN